ncbi:MAG: tRNA (guanosine(46)-N7)-methyltransferase TrmB [Fluviibacter sp.]|jgi:tRNA (guanine-N7-)-methyltransferase
MIENSKPVLGDLPAHLRRIRSFVRREGRLTEGQASAISRGWPQWGVDYTPTIQDWDTLFGRKAPRYLEIGFGMGGATAEIARHHPQNDYLGIEVHRPGMGNLLKLIEQDALTNLRLMSHDAVDVVNQMIAADSLDGVLVFFPDPWHKARHHKRRLIQPEFVRMLVSRLKPGGTIHCATDWENYAEQMLEVLSADPQLENTAADYAERPAYRPLTKFEARGLKLGHGVWDLVFRRK